jgi:hypothetical protein
MLDEIYYDDCYEAWIAKLWSDKRPNPEVPHVNISDEIEEKLDRKNSYECNTEERDGELWVTEVGEVICTPE